MFEYWVWFVSLFIFFFNLDRCIIIRYIGYCYLFVYCLINCFIIWLFCIQIVYGFLLKYFKFIIIEENRFFYFIEINWSDVVKKLKDSFKGCVNFDIQFIKLKGYLVSDDVKRIELVRVGFEEFKIKLDSWISGFW